MGRLEKTFDRVDLSTLRSTSQRLLQEFNGRISFGHPDTSLSDSSNGRLLNVEGSWVIVTLTNVSGNVTCTHNLDVPPITIVGGAATVYPANVRWLEFGKEYGDKTGTNATPATPGVSTVEFIRMVNGTMTKDSISISYSVTGFVPSATQPLTVTLFFTRALN